MSKLGPQRLNRQEEARHKLSRTGAVHLAIRIINKSGGDILRTLRELDHAVSGIGKLDVLRAGHILSRLTRPGGGRLCIVRTGENEDGNGAEYVQDDDKSGRFRV